MRVCRVCVCVIKKKKKLFFMGRSLSSGDTSELGGGDAPPSRALLHGSLLVVGRYAPCCRNKPLVRGLRHGSNVTWRHGSNVTWSASWIIETFGWTVHVGRCR